MAKIPADWKDAAAGEEQLSYVLYDGQLSTTTANTLLNMFKQTAAANGLKLTNMTKANELPSNQRFLLKKIACVFNDTMAALDVQKLIDDAFFELRINQKLVLGAPLRLLGPITSLVVPGVTDAIWDYMGPAFELENYLTIPGGTNFAFDLTTGDTAASASSRITIELIGDLVRSKN